MPFALSPERERKLEEILERYPTKMAATLPAPPPLPGAARLRQRRGRSSSSREPPRPVGRAREGRRHLLHALQPGAGRQAPGLGLPHAARARCAAPTTILAALREAARHARAARRRKDGKVTLRTAECLASCGTAPMMQVDSDYHENLTPRERRRDPRPAPRELSARASDQMLKRTDYLTTHVRRSPTAGRSPPTSATRRLPGRATRAHDDDARAGRRRGEEGEHPRARRRRASRWA